MSNELKPCPFCGGKDLKKEVIDGIEGMIYRVSCPHCANTMPMTVDTSMEEAIRIWNTRPVEDKLKQVNECIKREFDVLRVREKNIMRGYQKSINKATVFEYFLHSISIADYGKNLNSLSKTKLIEYLRFIQRNAIEILRGQE